MSHINYYKTTITDLEPLTYALDIMEIPYCTLGQSIALHRTNILPHEEEQLPVLRWTLGSYILYYDMDTWTDIISPEQFILDLTTLYNAEMIFKLADQEQMNVSSTEITGSEEETVLTITLTNNLLEDLEV